VGAVDGWLGVCKGDFSLRWKDRHLCAGSQMRLIIWGEHMDPMKGYCKGDLGIGYMGCGLPITND
jgi:hypothetical protein